MMRSNLLVAPNTFIRPCLHVASQIKTDTCRSDLPLKCSPSFLTRASTRQTLARHSAVH
jgi:hypothetical protein